MMPSFRVRVAFSRSLFPPSIPTKSGAGFINSLNLPFHSTLILQEG